MLVAYIRQFSRRLVNVTESGDTIVEVLVVLAVIGLSIGISYATANRSLLGGQQAQEHSEALQVLQTQIEELRTLVSSNTVNIYQSSYYCLATGSGVPTPDNPYNLATVINTNIASDSDLTDLSKYSVNCRLGQNSRYGVAILQSSTSPDTFRLTSYWQSAVGGGEDSVSLVYRAHPLPNNGQAPAPPVVPPAPPSGVSVPYTAFSNPNCSSPSDASKGIPAFAVWCQPSPPVTRNFTVTAPIDATQISISASESIFDNPPPTVNAILHIRDVTSGDQADVTVTDQAAFSNYTVSMNIPAGSVIEVSFTNDRDTCNQYPTDCDLNVWISQVTFQ